MQPFNFKKKDERKILFTVYSYSFVNVYMVIRFTDVNGGKNEKASFIYIGSYYDNTAGCK